MERDPEFKRDAMLFFGCVIGVYAVVALVLYAARHWG